jgi:hypothetical protein
MVHNEGVVDPETYRVSVNEILPNLWLGNQAASQNAEFIEKNKIGVVINCSKNIPCKFTSNCRYYRIAINDPGVFSVPDLQSALNQDDISLMTKVLPYIVQLIYLYLHNGVPVLVHCHAGMQRSAAVVAAYLMKYQYSGIKNKKLKYQSAYQQVLAKRPVAFNYGQNVNFGPALIYFAAVNS